MARRFATRIGAIRVNRFARIDSQKNPYFHNERAIRANRLKPAIRNFGLPEARFAKKKGFSSGTLKRFARIRRFARICANQFARIGPSKVLKTCYPKHLLRLFLRTTFKVKNSLKNWNNLKHGHLSLVLQCILGGVLKITSNNKNNFWGLK